MNWTGAEVYLYPTCSSRITPIDAIDRVYRRLSLVRGVKIYQSNELPSFCLGFVFVAVLFYGTTQPIAAKTAALGAVPRWANRVTDRIIWGWQMLRTTLKRAVSCVPCPSCNLVLFNTRDLGRGAGAGVGRLFNRSWYCTEARRRSRQCPGCRVQLESRSPPYILCLQAETAWVYGR